MEVAKTNAVAMRHIDFIGEKLKTPPETPTK